MQYIVNVSGGLTSYEALRRTIDRHGRDATHPVFADTRIEDPDLYRFLDDIETHLQVSITRLADGRTPFDVWHDERAITVRGPYGGGIAPCSRILKREVISRWIKSNFSAGSYTQVLGMDWSEIERIERMRTFYAPIPVWFPLAEPPYVDKCHIADQLERDGITVPRLYIDGFMHNNCGGGCVKAGQAHFAHLWRTHPNVYARWEAEEDRFNQTFDKNVAILIDKRGGGPRRPIPLRVFRERLERGEAFDTDEWGGCGCFAPVAQTRMDELLMEAKPRE